MAETLFPTDDEFFEYLPLVDSRVSVAFNEIVRRLKIDMPLKIAALNTRLGYPSGKGIKPPAPDAYYPAPAVLTDKYLNSVLVGVAVSNQAHSPGVIRTEAQVVVYVIDRRIEHENQVTDAWDKAGVVKGCLYAYLTGCEDADGHQCWTLLEPTGTTALPESYGEYSGVACYYRMVQDPTVDNWI